MYRRSAGLLLLSATLLHISNAHALAPVVLYSGTSAHLSHATSVFQIDPTSGKAWVNLFVPQGFHTEELYELDLYVEGLRYDSTRQQIIYQPDTDTQVICATTKSSGQGWFKRTRITPTGQCPISTQAVGVSTGTALSQTTVPANVVFAPRAVGSNP